MTADQESLALGFPMRPTLDGYLVVFDCFLRSTFAQQCFVCAGGISAGERVRGRFEVREKGERASRMFHACGTCCAAMAEAVAAGDIEGHPAIVARLALGQVRPPAVVGGAHA